MSYGMPPQGSMGTSLDVTNIAEKVWRIKPRTPSINEIRFTSQKTYGIRGPSGWKTVDVIKLCVGMPKTRVIIYKLHTEYTIKYHTATTGARFLFVNNNTVYSEHVTNERYIRFRDEYPIVDVVYTDDDGCFVFHFQINTNCVPIYDCGYIEDIRIVVLYEVIL